MAHALWGGALTLSWGESRTCVILAGGRCSL
jgi:hypothetical protein